MDYANLIRSGILLVAGLMFLLFPEKVYKLSVFLASKLPFKINVKRDRKYYPYFGIVWLIISAALFIYAVTR